MQRHETVVEISRAHMDEMVRAYVMAKFGIPATPVHDLRIQLHVGKIPDQNRLVVRILDPLSRPTSNSPP